MKRFAIRILHTACFVCVPAAFLLCLRPVPRFASVWKEYVSLPALHVLAAIGSRIPFSILEWGSILWLAGMILCGFTRGIGAVAVQIIKSVFTLAMCFILLWLPLYFAGEPAAYSASAAQLEASCRLLIHELNASALDFASLPDDLPAKEAAFSFWMQRLKIDGFYSFFTGEALVSPDLPGFALPFVAVHEAMHGAGYAGEGDANIAAWQECMRRGGTYADSARIWALKDSLALLRSMDAGAWRRCMDDVSPALAELLRQAGGGTTKPSRMVQAVFSLLGIGSGIQDYEMLALYLAANSTG